MKTTRLISSTLLASTLLLTGAVAISAAEEGKDPLNVSTEAKIEFKAGGDETDPEQPVDPEDPSKPIDPVEPDGETGGNGALRITYVPNLNFGKQKVTAQGKTYDALSPANGSASGRHWVQVSDVRGTLEGWNLKVSATPFKQGEDVLKGAELVFKKAKKDDEDGITRKDITLSENQSVASVMSAAKDSGAFYTSTVYGETDGVKGQGTEESPKTTDGVQLTVPGGSMKAGTYKSTLTWTLGDTPDNPGE